jgi:ribosomal protein L40E
MARKSLGYVELEWHCPSCGTRNPGMQKSCSNCGMPQPEDVEFVQPGQEKFITEQVKVEQIEAGPDIHCYYCGARNPANAATCSQCGADLSEGARRKSGRVLGAHRAKPAKQVECLACGALNEAEADKCIQCGASLVATPPEAAQPLPAKAAPARKGGGLLMIGIGALLLVVIAACAIFFVLYNRTEDLTGTVEAINWSRSIAIEGLVPVAYEDWQDEIPAEGLVGACTQEVRRTQDEPAPNAREVCGTSYTVDTGTGAGQVVQDCKYEILEPYCEYTLDEWREVDEATLSGNDGSPRWPDLSLRADQREGERSESYKIIFSTENGQHTYTTRDQNLFNQAQIGSRWILKVNTFNTVTDIEPLN